MALELFSYESMPVHLNSGTPNLHAPDSTTESTTWKIVADSDYNGYSEKLVQGKLDEGLVYTEKYPGAPAGADGGFTVNWQKFRTSPSINTDSIHKISIVLPGQDIPANIYTFVKSPVSGTGKALKGAERGLRFLGCMYSTDPLNLVKDKVDYAFFSYSNFSIEEATEGVKFTQISYSGETNPGEVNGILIMEIPASMGSFGFKAIGGPDNLSYSWGFLRKDNRYTIPAGNCQTEPTVTASIPVPFTQEQIVSIIPGNDRGISATVDNGVLNVVAKFNPESNVEINWTSSGGLSGGNSLHLYTINYKIGTQPYQYVIDQNLRESIAPQYYRYSIPYDPAYSNLKYYPSDYHFLIGRISDTMRVFEEETGESDVDWFTWDGRTVIMSTDKDDCDYPMIVSVYNSAKVEINNTSKSRTAHLKTYYAGVLLLETDIEFLPRDLSLEFSPYDTTVTYDTVSPSTVLQRKMGNYADLSFSIECITDPAISGTITVEADRVVEGVTYNDCEAHIPENLSGSIREWVVTAVYVDGDYRNQATWQIHQEPLEMEFEPDNEYIGADGGTLESVLSTNISDLSLVQFQGDIIPQLVSEENKTYSFVVPKNIETSDKVYRTRAIVSSSSGSQEASYTVTQERAAYSFVVNPSPIIVSAGNCTTMRLPVATAQIVSTFQEMPTIRVRDAKSGLEVTNLSRTEITVRTLFNPWSNEVKLGEIDFYIAGDLVATVEVKQEAAEFFGECVVGCPMKFPASGGQQTATISWNDNTITADSFNWTISPWFSLKTVYKGADSCGVFSTDLIVTAPVNNDLNNKEGQIKGTIAGKEWSPVVNIVQQKDERKLYFGCTGHLNLPSMGTEAGTQKDCANCVKLFFNTPNEADIIISEAYGGLTMNVGPVEQEDTYLWSRRLCFEVGENLSPTSKKWSITATYGDKTAILRIDQKGALFLRCNPPTIVFYRNGGERFLYLETNIGPEDIEVTQPDSNVVLTPWGSNTYNVKAGPNFYKSKGSLVTFRYKKDPTLYATCLITQVTQQEGDNYLVCYPQLITDIPESGGTYVIEAITNLTEDKLGVEWDQQYPVPEGWQFLRDTTDYKKIIVTVPPYDSVRNAVVRWYGKNISSKIGCTSFIEQGTPTPPYLYFNPSSTRVSYKGGKVVTTLLSGWESEPSIDYSGLGNLKYTVEKKVFTKDCATEDCPHGTTKTWTITIDVPETEDWADAVYLIKAEGPNNATALFTLTQSGVPVTPSMDTGECKCNLLDNIGMEALNRYFKHLSQFGYKSYSDVNRLLVLLFINEVLKSDMELCISEEDYRVIMNALYCVIDKTCLADYPIEDVYDSLIHPDLTDPKTVRITEDDILRHSERGDIRTVL